LGSDLVADGDGDLGDGSGDGGGQRVEHLHRFDDHARVAGCDPSAGLDRDFRDRARERCDDRVAVCGAADRFAGSDL
jgi:hypothetical protein